jgi:poly(A) polymerase
LTGEDLKQLGLPPGPLFKRLLDAVREAQLDGTIRTRQEALDLVKRLLEAEKELGPPPDSRDDEGPPPVTS